MEGMGRKGTNFIALLLPSFCGPYTGLFHQGQWPKTVEATILYGNLNTEITACFEVSYLTRTDDFLCCVSMSK
jgi:hypothetical protein